MKITIDGIEVKYLRSEKYHVFKTLDGHFYHLNDDEVKYRVIVTKS